MHEFNGRATVLVPATPQAAFALITDVQRLPEWNAAIEAVVERPTALTEGTTWTVKMHPPHMPSWGGISHLQELDDARLRFAYRTYNTDGNPSYVDWSWQVAEADAGTEVTVTWDGHLLSFDRRVFAGPLRRRQLVREVSKSLAALDQTLSNTPAR